MKHTLTQKKFDKNYYFGNVYTNYDDFLNWEDRARRLVSTFAPTSFLDIGCGCGNLVKEIRRLYPDIHAHGVDSSDFAVKHANSPHIQLAHSQKLPFMDCSFDTVYILTTFSYIPVFADVRRSLAEAYRVAKSVIVFDDVYSVPAEDSDDYDPNRVRVHSQEEWVEFWKEVMCPDDTIFASGDEIVLHKHTR